MLKLERYEIKQSSDGIDININQRKNAVVNIALSSGLVAFAAYSTKG